MHAFTSTPAALSPLSRTLVLCCGFSSTSSLGPTYESPPAAPATPGSVAPRRPAPRRRGARRAARAPLSDPALRCAARPAPSPARAPRAPPGPGCVCATHCLIKQTRCRLEGPRPRPAVRTAPLRAPRRPGRTRATRSGAPPPPGARARPSSSGAAARRRAAAARRRPWPAQRAARPRAGPRKRRHRPNRSPGGALRRAAAGLWDGTSKLERTPPRVLPRAAGARQTRAGARDARGAPRARATARRGGCPPLDSAAAARRRPQDQVATKEALSSEIAATWDPAPTATARPARRRPPRPPGRLANARRRAALAGRGAPARPAHAAPLGDACGVVSRPQTARQGLTAYPPWTPKPTRRAHFDSLCWITTALFKRAPAP